MLSLLHIENIAVIESADISFDRGFNVLTGETAPVNPSSLMPSPPFWASGPTVT